jgi:hypothetical protein
MKKLINLCCFINIDLTDPNIKKVNGELFCNERIGEYNIARRLSRSIGSDFKYKKYHQLHSKYTYFENYSK